VGFFRLGQGLKPFGQFRETFGPRGLRETGIHLGVFVGLALDRRLEILFRGTDGHAGARITDFFQKIQMTKGMSSFGLRSISKKAADIWITLDIRDPREVEIAAIRLRLAGEGMLQIVVAFCAVQTLCLLLFNSNDSY